MNIKKYYVHVLYKKNMFLSIAMYTSTLKHKSGWQILEFTSHCDRWTEMFISIPGNVTIFGYSDVIHLWVENNICKNINVNVFL